MHKAKCSSAVKAEKEPTKKKKNNEQQQQKNKISFHFNYISP